MVGVFRDHYCHLPHQLMNPLVALKTLEDIIYDENLIL